MAVSSSTILRKIASLTTNFLQADTFEGFKKNVQSVASFVACYLLSQQSRIWMEGRHTRSFEISGFIILHQTHLFAKIFLMVKETCHNRAPNYMKTMLTILIPTHKGPLKVLKICKVYLVSI